jgi:hypothetical protein
MADVIPSLIAAAAVALVVALDGIGWTVASRPKAHAPQHDDETDRGRAPRFVSDQNVNYPLDA